LTQRSFDIMPKRKDAEKPGQDTKPPKAASTKRSKSKAAEPVLEEAGSGLVDVTRTRVLSGSLTGAHGNGGVVYWMSRDQRVRDNWALLHARDLALKQKKPLHVAFCLLPTFLGATLRQFSHMLAGLAEVEESLRTLKVPFVMLRGQPRDTLPGYVAEHGLSAVVTDYSPLRISKLWKGQVGEALGSVPLIEVDAHNIVPVWVASDKQAWGAHPSSQNPQASSALPYRFPRVYGVPAPAVRTASARGLGGGLRIAGGRYYSGTLRVVQARGEGGDANADEFCGGWETKAFREATQRSDN